MTTTAMVSSSQANGVQAAPRGSVAPALITDEHRQILRQMVDRNASPAQIETLIVVGKCTKPNRYDLDPLMGHVVLINGKCFVTHKGLMHKAHTSGHFDGIRHSFGKDGLGEFCECQVFRKDMTHAFEGRIYLDEYRNAGPVWKQYPRAMAAKTAESFVLRRAFDVALTSQEEMGVADSPPPQRVYSAEEKAERKALSERITGATKALTQSQFASFKVKVAESGGLPQMETGELRSLLDQVDGVARANVSRSEHLASTEVEVAEPAQQSSATSPTPSIPAVDEDMEDDPFADDGVAGPEGG